MKLERLERMIIRLLSRERNEMRGLRQRPDCQIRSGDPRNGRSTPANSVKGIYAPTRRSALMARLDGMIRIEQIRDPVMRVSSDTVQELGYQFLHMCVRCAGSREK